MHLGPWVSPELVIVSLTPFCNSSFETPADDRQRGSLGHEPSKLGIETTPDNP